MATTSETTSYFSQKASTYDLVDEQVYWRLSDELLWALLRDRVLPSLPPDLRFLDAGGGTGRWTDRIARAVPAASGLVVDLTAAMLDVGRQKAADHGYEKRVRYATGDLDTLPRTLDPVAGRFDLAICFHNVIGFVQDPQACVEHIAAALDPSGLFVLMAPSRFHAAFFNLTLGRLDRAAASIEGRSRFTDDMPDIWLFTPDTMRTSFELAGLEVLDLVGFPSLVYPGIEETREEGTSEGAARILDDPTSYRRILELELGMMSQPGTAARGNNLVIVGRKG